MSYINNINLYGYIGGGVFYSDMMMPDYKSKRIVLNPFYGNSYIAEKNGFFGFEIYTNATTNGAPFITVDGIKIWSTTACLEECIFPILKDSVVTMSINGSGRTIYSSILFWYDLIPFK